MDRNRFPALGLLGLLLLGSAAQADTDYQIRSIVKLGDRAGDLQIKNPGAFEIGTLTNAGHFVFVTRNAAGGEVLFHYADQKLTPIAAGGTDGPMGKWPRGVAFFSPVSMNERDQVVFTAATSATSILGTFRWDPQAQQVSPVVLKGMRAVNNLPFEGAGANRPVINNSGDIAFSASIKNASGEAAQGVFFLGRDNQLAAVALPDQELPDGGRVVRAGAPSLDDLERVSFFSHRTNADWAAAYLWEKGETRLMAESGTDAPDGTLLFGFLRAWPNPKNRNVLLWISHLPGEDPPDPLNRGLVWFADGELKTVVAPGQKLAEGVELLSVDAVSDPNTLGQHVFVARLQGGGSIVCRLHPDSTLSLLLKSGMTTEHGKITHLAGDPSGGESSGIGLNSKGQVVLPVRYDDGTVAIVLLTPLAP